MSLSRRDFLKLAALSLGGLGLRPWQRLFALSEFPTAERLGRVVWAGSPLKTQPSSEAQTVRALSEDELLPWLHSTAGYHATEVSQTWVETPEGYVYAPHLQPVKVEPNQPLDDFLQVSPVQGMWAQVSVPYVDLVLENQEPAAPWLEYHLDSNLPPRFYYDQIVWIDQLKIEGGQTWYRINERYGSYSDIFWADAQAFRPITPEELAPIRPEVEDKRVVVDVNHQVLSCFEGQTEVYFCRISTGALYAASGRRVDTWATPLGSFPIWRKLVSLHMSGNTTGGGWDVPAIGWTSLFIGAGIAVHATFWHNNFGVPMSNGCVNARPEDARFVFRWTQPAVPYDPGDITVSMPGGTLVYVIES